MDAIPQSFVHGVSRLDDCVGSSDRNTIWRFRELLMERHLIRPLFNLFDAYIYPKGFFDHVTADTDHKFIRDWIVTSANVHDSSPYLSILPERAIGDQTVYADSAYSASEIMAELKYRGFHPEICQKGYKGDPLTEEQKSNNNRKSKIRCRIEHIFGDMTNRMKTLTIRTIGLARAEVKIGLMNLAYNMRRFRTLTKKTEITPF